VVAARAMVLLLQPRSMFAGIEGDPGRHQSPRGHPPATGGVGPR
jgi:hypothetical protein